MPKVSPEHLAGRRRQILDAALTCFAEKGFQVTSMQDIFARSGLSPGAVYRYFRGKDEIIAAIASETIPYLLRVIEDAEGSEPPPAIEDVIGDAIGAIQRLDRAEDRMRTAVQVWGEALHNPSVAAQVTGFIGAARAALTRLVRRAQDAGQVSAALDPEVTARVLLAFLPGFLLQSALFPHEDREAFERTVRVVLRGHLHAGPVPGG